MVAAGKGASNKLLHARILLKADAAPTGPAWIDARIADAFDVSTGTVERLRERFVAQGLDAALGDEPATPSKPKRLVRTCVMVCATAGCSHRWWWPRRWRGGFSR